MDTEFYYYIIAALLMSIASGLVGAFALMRRMTLAADVISHVALPGLGLAVLYGINPLIGGGATLLVGTLLIWRLEKLTNTNTDAIIGVVFAVSLAVGALLATEEELIDALFGEAGPIHVYEFTAGVVASLLVIWFTIKNRYALLLSLMSRDLAKTAGLNYERLNLYFLLIFSLTVLLGLKFLGVLLMGSLIIIPAAIARNVAGSLKTMLVVSSLSSMLSVTLGLIISSYYAVALGPVIIGIAGVLFIISVFLRRS